MKSVVQAGWLLTTAVGNLFDVIIASLHIHSQVGCVNMLNTAVAVTLLTLDHAQI